MKADPRPFEDYATSLGIPGDKWLLAGGTLEDARKTAGDENLTLATDEEKLAYRLLTALDYFLCVRQQKNHYMRFILAVTTAERLFSLKSEDNKGEPLAFRIGQFLAASSPKDLALDYKVRNDLVHGPERKHAPQDVAALADKWTALCCQVLSEILVNKRLHDLKAAINDTPAART